MKLEQSEKLFIESLITIAIEEKAINGGDITLDKLAGDASTRRYYRALVGSNNYVVCLDDPVKIEGQRNEFLRVQKVLSENNVRVPKIYFSILEKGFILEEDLGNQTFLESIAGTTTKGDEFEKYCQAIDLLVQVHNVDYKKYPSETFSKISFDHSKLFNEIIFTRKHFIEKYLGCALSESEEKVFNNLFSDICTILSKGNFVFTHRDYHSRNLMFKNEELIVIDFQDARLGIPQYDLVSIVEDCYFKIDRENKEKLINYYIQKMSIENSAEFNSVYDLMAIQRLFKAIGSFCYIYHLRGDLRYLKYIAYTYENLRRFLLKKPGLSPLMSLLNKVYYAH